MEITIEHPNDRPNFAIVDFGNISLAFSYRTLVGIKIDWDWKVIENCWGPTTGKHLNWLDNGDKESRLSADEFEELMESLRIGVATPLRRSR